MDRIQPKATLACNSAKSAEEQGRKLKALSTLEATHVTSRDAQCNKMEQGPNCVCHLLLSMHSVYKTVVATRTFALQVASRVASRPVCMGPKVLFLTSINLSCFLKVPLLKCLYSCTTGWLMMTLLPGVSYLPVCGSLNIVMWLSAATGEEVNGRNPMNLTYRDKTMTGDSKSHSSSFFILTITAHVPKQNNAEKHSPDVQACCK